MSNQQNRRHRNSFDENVNGLIERVARERVSIDEINMREDGEERNKLITAVRAKVADLYGIQSIKTEPSSVDLPDKEIPPAEVNIAKDETLEASPESAQVAPGKEFSDLSEINSLGDIQISAGKEKLKQEDAEKTFEFAQNTKNIFDEKIREAKVELNSAVLEVLNDLDRRMTEYPDALPDAYKKYIKDLIEVTIGSLANIDLFFEAIGSDKNIFQMKEVFSKIDRSSNLYPLYLAETDSLDAKIGIFLTNIWSTLFRDNDNFDLSHLFQMLAGSLPVEVPDFKETEKTNKCLENLKESILNFGRHLGWEIPIDKFIPYKFNIFEVAKYTPSKSINQDFLGLVPHYKYIQQDSKKVGEEITRKDRAESYFYKRVELGCKQKIGNSMFFGGELCFDPVSSPTWSAKQREVFQNQHSFQPNLLSTRAWE